MVERIEHLRQPERVFGQTGELERSNHLFDHLIKARGLENDRPEASAFAVSVGEQLVRGRHIERADHVHGRQPFTLAQLVEDVVGTDHRVLQVRTRLALEAERLLDVEDDQLAARELQQEIPDRGDGNL